jgi:hypothetical protein
MTLPEVPVRNLGSQGLQAAVMGLGCMGMTWRNIDPSGTHKEEDSIATIHRAKELGVTFLGESATTLDDPGTYSSLDQAGLGSCFDLAGFSRPS